MNRAERAALNPETNKAIMFARPVVMESIRAYKRLEKVAALIRRQVEPIRLKLVIAQSRQDELEADKDLLETLKQANRRSTDGERKGTNLDKYNYSYTIGKQDNFDLASENDTLTGAILTKS